MKRTIKILLCCIIALAENGTGFAQKQGQPLIDSLLQEISKRKDDTGKVKLQIAVSGVYRTFNIDEGIRYGQQAMALSTKLKWKKGEADGNNSIGSSYYMKSDMPNALAYYQKALRLIEEAGDKKGIATVTGNIGLIYQHQGDYPRALHQFNAAIKTYEERGNKTGIARVTEHIGNVYFSQSDYSTALQYYLKSLRIKEDLGDKNSVATAIFLIGSVYESQNDYPKALEYFFSALKNFEEAGDKISEGVVIENIGTVYMHQHDNAKALEYYFRSMKMAEEVGDQQRVANSLANIGSVYNDQKNYAGAIEYMLTAQKILEEVGDKSGAAINLCNIGNAYLSIVKDTSVYRTSLTEIKERKQAPVRISGQPAYTIPDGREARLNKSIEYLERGLALGKEISTPEVCGQCYGYLSEVFKLKGDYKRAYECADHARIIRDSVFSRESSEQIVKMGMKNEYDRQRLADSLKTHEKEKITALKLQRQRNYTYMGVVGILLLAGFSFFIFKERGKSEMERKRSDDLLLNILPSEIADELKANGSTKAKHFENVTVLLTDFVNFTHAGERMSPQNLIDELHACFKAFDEIMGKHGIEKIKTIGDAYLAVCGLPQPDVNHAEKVVKAAIEICAFMQDRVAKLGERTFHIRVGIHSGSVVAGIVGVKKFAFDIWGDTVNTAARMEQNSEAGKINVSQATYDLIKDKFNCEYRGEIVAKNKGGMNMYFVVGSKTAR